MIELTTGIDIVTKMSGGKTWWKLSAADVGPWLEDLSPAALRDQSNHRLAVGRPWVNKAASHECEIDSHSTSVQSILADITLGLRNLGVAQDALPKISDVRTSGDGVNRDYGLVIDVDFGDFILPVLIHSWRLKEPTQLASISTKILGLVREVARRKGQFLSREKRFRNAFEAVVERIGCGAAPLWLRLEPISCWEENITLRDLSYQTIVVMLSRSLDWEPVGSTGIRTVAELRSSLAWEGQFHRKRYESASLIYASCAVALVDPVAKALIEKHGLDPIEVASAAREGSRQEAWKSVDFHQGEDKERIYYQDGVLRAYFSIGILANFHHDELMIERKFPVTIGLGARGRLLSDFVDHPVLKASEIRIASATTDERGLILKARMGSEPICMVANATATSSLLSHNPME